MPRGYFDYKQFMQFYRETAGIQKTFNRWIHAFLLQEALIALKLVRPLTPWRTGTLRRSWSITRVERTGQMLIVYLVNPIEYASFMEDGFTYQTNEGEKYFEGFHMAEISLLQVRQKMPLKFEREFTKWLAGFGWR